MQEDTPAASAAEPAPVVQPAAAPPETVAPAAPAQRSPFVALKPLMSGPKVVEAGKIVSLTAAQAAEFAKLIRPATAEDLAIFSQAPIEL